MSSPYHLALEVQWSYPILLPKAFVKVSPLPSGLHPCYCPMFSFKRTFTIGFPRETILSVVGKRERISFPMSFVDVQDGTLKEFLSYLVVETLLGRERIK